MATWNHKDIEIGFDEARAVFFATIDGVRLKASSLAAMRDKITKRAAAETFEILCFPYGAIDVRRIVDAAKGDFIDDAGRAHSAITRNTPENRTLVERYQKLRKENNDKIDELKREISEAYEAIPRERVT